MANGLYAPTCTLGPAGARSWLWLSSPGVAGRRGRPGAAVGRRRLGLLLLQRDYLNILKWDAQENGGLTEQGRRASNSIHEIFEREFSDPKDRYYSLSMDILQEMMSITQQGMRYDIIIRPNPDGAHHFSQPSQLENYIYKQATSLVESSFAESADLVHFEGT